MAEVGWRMEAVRPGGSVRAFTPEASGSFSFDLTRDVPKTITGIRVAPEQWAAVDVRLDQIRVYLELDDIEYPMGVFAFSELTRQKAVVKLADSSAGDLITTGLSDRCLLLVRNTGRAQTIVATFDPAQEMQQILAAAGIPYSIAGSANLSTTGITWDGSVTDLAKVRQLGTLAGHRPLWMDNNGVIRSVSSQVIETEIIPLADLIPAAGSIGIVEKFLTAPNRVIVSDNSAAFGAILGQWDAPASAPHSYANRGYVLAEVRELQGLGSGAHAQDVAATLGEAFTARSLSAQIVPTPLLDGPVILGYDEANWLVTGWDVSLEPGATMRVTAEELINA